MCWAKQVNFQLPTSNFQRRIANQPSCCGPGIEELDFGSWKLEVALPVNGGNAAAR
jgi:hypothetical protein